MDFTEPESWTQLRTAAAEFAAEEATRAAVEAERRSGDGANRDITRALGKRGWVAPAWPGAEGGADLGPLEAAVLSAALRQAGVPTTGHWTTMLAANAIRALGSDDLKRRILPGVAAGEILISLGYTEPGGGSDVFACTTTADQDGDAWIVNGPTFAHLADYAFLMTRSVPGSAGPRGLTMLLVPLESPGIEIQAVRTLGHERTNIVNYSGVRVPDANRVGAPHRGLAVMQAALEAEQNVAPALRTGEIAAHALKFARAQTGPDGEPLIYDPLVRERLARMAMEAEVADLLTLRAAFLDAAGDRPGPVTARWGPASYLRASAAALDLAGPAGLLDWTDPAAPVDGSLASHYRSAVATTIYGGSNEVLRSPIAEPRPRLIRAAGRADEAGAPRLGPVRGSRYRRRR
jgi:3-oxocholest-4-en-26-oyl-CoA dehydrogenase alpha subunit